MNPELSELFRRVDDLKPEIRSVWAYLVDRDCGTKNKAGMDAIGAAVASFLGKCGFSVRAHEYEEVGNFLVAEKGDTTKPFICLACHLDTVFPDGEAFNRPFTIRDGVVTGPGCLDMKGGVTAMLFALKVLAEKGWSRYPVKVLLTGDEETAHRGSNAGRDLIEESRGGFAGFNFDTSFIDNSIVLGRKGYAVFRVEVDGVGAHAGNNPEDGRSAIIELAHKMLEIDALADHEKGTLVNVGVMQGGTVPNASPDKASCVVDVRYERSVEMDRIRAAMESLTKKAWIEGTRTRVELKVDVPAMERTEKSEELFERVNRIAVDAGLPEMKPISTGGGSDSVFLSRAGVPTLCGLGAKGEFNHTEREYAIEDSVYERAKLLIAILEEL